VKTESDDDDSDTEVPQTRIPFFGGKDDILDPLMACFFFSICRYSWCCDPISQLSLELDRGQSRTFQPSYGQMKGKSLAEGYPRWMSAYIKHVG
jgi:hypothetical protein